MEYTNPVEEIRKSWKVAFRRQTWLDGVTFLLIQTSERFEPHLAIVHRLNPRELHTYNAACISPEDEGFLDWLRAKVAE